MLFGTFMKAYSHLSGASKKPSGFPPVLKPYLSLFPFGSGFADVADIMIFFTNYLFLLNREHLIYMKEK